MEEIFINSNDGIRIAINEYKSGFESVVIVAPGWFMTKDSKYIVQICEMFAKYTDVLSLDFRGHGRSSGFYTFTRKEENDLNAVIDYAKTKYKKIYLAGFSLGAAIVVNAAAKRPRDISKVIAVSAPDCFEKIENCFWKKEAWIPTFQKTELKRWFSIRPSFPFGEKTRPIDVIKDVKCPILFLAGEKDPTIGYIHTKELYEKAVCKKSFELFKNCCHAEDLFIQNREKFTEVCINWIINE